MGQATRTTKLLLDLGKREEGGANTGKRAYLEATGEILNQAHAEKLAERVAYYSERHLEMRTRAISPNELLTWAETHTVATRDHPHPWEEWNFSDRFPDMPFAYRRAAIKDAIGKARSYLSNLAHWEKSGKKRGKPGVPGAANHPTLYEGTVELDLSSSGKEHARFVRLKVYTGTTWQWRHYPIKHSRYFQHRLTDPAWEKQSPKLVVRKTSAELHFSQTKEVKAKKIVESKHDPDLVTVAVDLNVKMLAVITVRQRGTIRETVFVRDQGLDQARYRHLKCVAKKQWQSGKPVKGEHSNLQLWGHIRRMNEDAAHRVARRIANVCANYPGCVLVFGGRGERFSNQGHKRIAVKWGKLFWCPSCHYEIHADLNASFNVHHSFYREYHWQPRGISSGCPGQTRSLRLQVGGKKLPRGTPRPRLGSQAGCCATYKVVRLSSVLRRARSSLNALSDIPESITSWNSEGTPGRLD